MVWPVVFLYIIYVGKVNNIPAYSSPSSRNLFLCPSEEFHCLNDRCIRKSWFCDGSNDCGDNSDEKYCKNNNPLKNDSYSCPQRNGNYWLQCKNGERCFPPNFRCDGIPQCEDASDENNCFPANKVQRFAGVLSAKSRLARWILSGRKNGTTTNKWGPQVHRIATALYLADENFYAPGNQTGEEIAYELTIQILTKLLSKKRLKSQMLSLYINALVAACIDPKNFYGHNLVFDLRSLVDAKTYTNPLEMIALCNAKDFMTQKDMDRIVEAYDSQYRLPWTDTQSLAVMAYFCVSSLTNIDVDREIVQDMLLELKQGQNLNGTIGNLKTTALVIQALIASNSLSQDFDLQAAVKMIVQQQRRDGSYPTLLDAYYILPVLSYKSLVNIKDSHCQKPTITGEEALKELQFRAVDSLVQIKYSVFIGQELDMGRTWQIKVPAGSTIYDVMEAIQKLDLRYKVLYNELDGKLYPSAMFNLEDDPEVGLYWFVYKRSIGSQNLQLVKESPAIEKIHENEEVILWYKYEDWNNFKKPLEAPTETELPSPDISPTVE